MKRLIALLALAVASLHLAAIDDPPSIGPDASDTETPAHSASLPTNEVDAVAAETAGEPASPPLEDSKAEDSTDDGADSDAGEQTESKLGLETHIYSDSAEFGLSSRLVTYYGNVRVKDPRMSLTCEQLIAKVPSEGTRLEQIVAKTNVVITASDEQGRDYTAKGDMAVYTYEVNEGVTNEVVELSGSPVITSPDGKLEGEVILWDRTKNVMKAINQRTVFVLPEETEADLLKEVGPKENAEEAEPAPEDSGSDSVEKEQPE